MLIDTHCHLDAEEFDTDRDVVIQAACDAGVRGIVVPAIEVANFDRVAALSASCPVVRHAYGIHPLFVERARDEDVEVLAERLERGDAVAVGEIGLDHYVRDLDPALQERFFVAQLRLAKKLDLPVILHVRRAVDAVLKQLRRIEVPGGIAHAFNGSRQQADILIGMGFKLGFGGAATFDGSRRIRALAAELPLAALVLETDAPDIRPAWAQNVPNQPANVSRFAEVIAGLRGMGSSELIAATGANAVAALPRLKSLVP